MRIAIVTGASSGIGLEFVRQIFTGYPKLDEIWVLARRTERLEALRQELSNKIRVLPTDLSNPKDLQVFCNLLQQEHPDVKLLVNSAGYGMISAFEHASCEEQLGMIDLNCRALTEITYRVLPYMHKNSRILQVASAAAFLPQPDFAVYAASKAYVLSFSRALGIELSSRGITVTAICPGPVKTEFFDVADPKHQIKAYKRFFMVKPERVVAKALRNAALGDALSIYGIPMKLFYGITAMIPHGLLLRFFKGGNVNEKS